MKHLTYLVFILLPCMASAQSPVGTWKTVDDDSGDARSYVEIYEKGGMLFGKITKLLDKDPGVICEPCTGAKKDKPVLGLVIIESLKPYKDYWRKGTILDPENGKEYDCTIWLEDGTLKVKGKHWSGFSRTQTWYPSES